MYPNRLRIRQHPTKGFYGKSSAGEKQNTFLSKCGINVKDKYAHLFNA